jgi:hypothetical protein
MKITFRCASEHEALLPRPVLAKGHLPDWLKRMPASAISEVAGTEVRTLKHCPPFIEAVGAGFLMPLACDIRIRNGTFAWESPLPPLDGSLDGRSPLGVHVPEQAVGSPLAQNSRFILKFMNPWSIQSPPGVSVLFCHPFNRNDLPFRTITGIVDCDRYALGQVHFPALWVDPDFEGVLAAGTPIAQAVPFHREELSLDIGSMNEQELAARAHLQDALHAGPGFYRKLRA